MGGVALGVRGLGVGPVGGGYADAVLGTGPIAYWPLDETAGAVARCLVNSGQNGTVAGVTWANDATGSFGTPAPFFDGANDYVNIYSAALNASYNGATGSMMIWCKVNGAGVWTDGKIELAMDLHRNLQNRYSCRKDAANNTVQAKMAAGTGLDINYNPFSSTDWFQIILTWSDGNNDDEAKMFIDATQQGGTSAGLSNWAVGALAADKCVIGAYSTTPHNVWHGWLAHAALWDRVLSGGEILALANP